MPFTTNFPCTTADVKVKLDFSAKDKTGASEAMVQLQTEGVAALCNILAKYPFAYLADEVGLGKTMQGLGVIAMLKAQKPAARILIIAPRENVQQGWKTESEKLNELILQGMELPEVRKYERLRDFLADKLDPGHIGLLRHTSFMRPMTVSDNLDKSWANIKGYANALGLALPDNMPTRDADKAGFAFNHRFMKAVNDYLLEKNICFDLVVMDEAQALRNPNQTNEMFYTMVKGRVRKWLFLSATPAHSGAHNLEYILNRYPYPCACSGNCSCMNPYPEKAIPEGMLNQDDGYAALQQRLSDFMIRRPRRYNIAGQEFRKQEYRQDRKEEWAESCHSPLATLSMALVQKRLVKVLDGQSNRFRIGYMDSFESLSASLHTSLAVEQAAKENQPDEEEHTPSKSDYYADKNHHLPKEKAPDSAFVEKLASDFYKKFKFDLPHPKIDRTAREVATLAFGDPAEKIVGGSKTLIFVRRISTVEALKKRLIIRFISAIESRYVNYWGLEKIKLKDGPNGKSIQEDMELDPHFPESAENDAPVIKNEKNTLRIAMQEKMWLGRFRRTFFGTGRNTLFFEENWFKRLCIEGDVDPEEAVNVIPVELWQESQVYAVTGESRNKKNQSRYLVWHLLDRQPAVFGLPEEKVLLWKEALSNIFPNKLKEKVVPDNGLDAEKSEVYRDVLLFESIWSLWDKYLGQYEDMVLPASASLEEIYCRQILKTVIGQYFRQSEVLVDLYCAQQKDTQKFPDTFMKWLADKNQIDAIRIRQHVQDWIKHHRLIFTSAFGSTKEPVELVKELADTEHFDYLNKLEPVVGVTGSSGGHKRVIEQFNTPGYPYIMIGTDTIREGVNLHLFCDRVVHYGLAWTSGDLEQRNGRVDRFFSLFERRLGSSAEPRSLRMDIYFPHVKDSLERRQVEVVLARKKVAEELMDSPLAGGLHTDEDKKIGIDEIIQPSKALKVQIQPEEMFSAKKHIKF